MSFKIAPVVLSMSIFVSVVYGYSVPIVPTYQSPTLIQSTSLGLAPLKSIYGKPLTDSYNPNPQYSFAYKIEDSYTGDSKSQEEQRNGDVVKGQYSLNDADGYRRIVDYSSDGINGFNAIVTRQPIAVKSIIAQPIIKTEAKPILQNLPSINVQSNYYPSSSSSLIKASPLSYVNSQPIINSVSYASPLIASPIVNAY